MLLVLLLAVWVDASPPTASDIERLVADLASPRFAIREKAQQRLWEAGRPAEPAVRQATKSGDAEAARRARQLVDKYDWGVYCDTPAEVVAAVGAFRGGDDEARRQALGSLVKLGRAALVPLQRIGSQSADERESQFIRAVLARAVRDELPNLMRSGDLAGAESMLEACLSVGENRPLQDHYLAVVILADHLQTAGAAWTARAKSGQRPAVDIAVALQRAAGDFAGAKALAAAARRSDLIELVLRDQGDWAALAKLSIATPPERSGEHDARLAAQATFARLAGNPAGFETLLAKLRTQQQPVDRDKLPIALAGVLMANERTEEALALLEGTVFRPFVFVTHVARADFGKALALAEKQPVEEFAEGGGSVTLRHAGLRAQLGQSDRSKQLFNQYAAQLKAPVDGEWVAELIRAELAAGFEELAREHATGYLESVGRLATTERTDPTPLVLGALVPDHGVEAGVWWQHLRARQPDWPARRRLDRVIAMVQPGQETRAPMDDLLRGLERALPEDVPSEHYKALCALAIAYANHGDAAAARHALTRAAEQADGSRGWLALGDFDRARREYARAADAYRRAGLKVVNKALPLYLEAECRRHLGDAKAAAELEQQAFRLSAGYFSDRVDLAFELDRRGLAAAARQQREFVLRAIGYRDDYVGSLIASQAREAVSARDFRRAAQLLERLAAGRVYFADFRLQGAMQLGAEIHLTRARAELSAGHVDLALREAETSLRLMPGNVDVAIHLVPGLQRLNRSADADELYRHVTATYRQHLGAYPESPWLHNDLAWCAARCRRNLDDALDHARRAVERRPDYPGYHDTLAEVHLQRGDQAQAVSAAKRAVALAPDRAYNRQQLRRMEANDRDTPPAEPE